MTVVTTHPMHDSERNGKVLTDNQAQGFRQTFEALVGSVAKVVVGKDDVIRLAFTCLLSDGHLLLEDVPGTGKTLLARTVAAAVGGSNSRIQFTPDLLPSDVTGVMTYDQRRNDFEFKRGPIFHSIVLADEINRASPKTQAALLEAMEEQHVTDSDGKRHDLPEPFMVIATQNPVEQSGTYPLPEAQLDRFLMKTSLGYPSHEVTVALLADAANRRRDAGVQPVIAPEQAQPREWVKQLREWADAVTVRRELLELVSRIAAEARPRHDGAGHKHVRLGVSTRGALGLVRAAKTWAIAHGRVHVETDDIVALLEPVLGHRILLTDEAIFEELTPAHVLADVKNKLNLPHRRGY